MLPADFQYPFLIRGFLCVLVLAPMLGGLSHLVVTRRMAFFSAALGQAALTGVAIGLLLGEPLNAPYGGMFGFCLLSTLAMVYVKRHATLPPDTLIGVFHALTLGLGLCLLVALTRQFNVHQVESVLFGSLLTVTDGDLLLLLVVGVIGLAVLLVRQYNNLLLDSLSPPLASVAGAESAFLEYFFAMLLTLVDRGEPEGDRRAAGRGAGGGAGGRGAQPRARARALFALERRGGVPRRRRRPGDLDAAAGADRRRRGAGGQRDLLPDARNRVISQTCMNRAEALCHRSTRGPLRTEN